MPASNPTSDRRELPLLDTNDRYDAWLTGRTDGPEDWRDGCGLRVLYDGTGYLPCVYLNGPDGEVQLTGRHEISAVADALATGARLAERFGDPPCGPLEWAAGQTKDKPP